MENHYKEQKLSDVHTLQHRNEIQMNFIIHFLFKNKKKLIIIRITIIDKRQEKKNIYIYLLITIYLFPSSFNRLSFLSFTFFFPLCSLLPLILSRFSLSHPYSYCLLDKQLFPFRWFTTTRSFKILYFLTPIVKFIKMKKKKGKKKKQKTFSCYFSLHCSFPLC